MDRRPQDRDDAGRVTAVVVRPIGSAMPLGFVGLAVATFIYAGYQLGWISTISQRTIVGVLLIAFPVALQLTASVIAFLSRDGATGTALGTLAVTWLSIGGVLILSPPASTSGALGLLLLASGAALILTSTAAVSSKVIPALVLLVVGVRFALGGVYELGAGEGWQDASAAVGLGLAALAAYAALAMELEDAHGRTVLPLGRRKTARGSMTGDLAEQVAGVAHEPGVRKRL